MVTFIPNFLEKMAGQKRSREDDVEELQVTEDKLKAAKDKLKVTEDELKETKDELKEAKDELKADKLKAAEDRLSRDECHLLKSLVDKLLESKNILQRKADNLDVNVGDLQTKLNELNTSKFIVLKCSMHALTLHLRMLSYILLAVGL